MKLAQPLVARGMPLDQAMSVVAPPFPVAGLAKYSDDWMNPRWTPCPHLHEGTDIFADFGTPVVASKPGVYVTGARTPVGGVSAWVASDDGSSFYYAHLERLAGLQPGQRVEPGTVIGYVGDTGNAEGGAPHVHLEYHLPLRNRTGSIIASGVSRTAGGVGRSLTPPVNPKPYLDQWLAIAESRAPVVVADVGKRLSAFPLAGGSGQAELLQLSALKWVPGIFGLAWRAHPGFAAAALAMGLLALIQALVAIMRSRKPVTVPVAADIKPAPSRRRSGLRPGISEIPPTRLSTGGIRPR